MAIKFQSLEEACNGSSVAWSMISVRSSKVSTCGMACWKLIEWIFLVTEAERGQVLEKELLHRHQIFPHCSLSLIWGGPGGAGRGWAKWIFQNWWPVSSKSTKSVRASSRRVVIGGIYVAASFRSLLDLAAFWQLKIIFTSLDCKLVTEPWHLFCK